ncbi:uncharacterized protein BXZ73DRAFT_95357 [Epithele typhae]|uniref:uncharacterized protein n=1 Tax=Epithele typhae TaxID=378194 RepID=UPI002008E9E8|nr:uncharacterized protein BXZ73DRAFT_95357 [Epithele typhae]KAH9945836.1 hypothetical protein BXZ73DRAFT_95357 [Epithele typhae]
MSSSSAPTSANPPRPSVPPRPSAAVIVVNARNEVLMVQRNPNASNFANAHVFPGGNWDEKQDGEGGLALTAIRELFEETGLLLAHPPPSGRMPSDAELDAAREDIHAQRRMFTDFLAQHALRPNVEALLPFTQWITPPMMSPRRFHAHFYVAFLLDASPASSSSSPTTGDRHDRLPTPDGGAEVVAARFAHPERVLADAAAHRIALFAPQFYLLRTLAGLLAGPASRAPQREQVRALARGAFGRMVVNPRPVPDADADRDGWSVLAYEGDEARGGPRGRRHRCRIRPSAVVATSDIVLERNFDIFTELEETLGHGAARL